MEDHKNIYEKRVSEEEPFYYNEKVDVVKPREQKVLDAQIISMRGRVLVVRYSDTNEEETLHLDDHLVLKQWVPGRPYRRLNRVDVRSHSTKDWHEGVIIELEADQILVRFLRKIERKIDQEWHANNSKNIAEAGRYSGKFNPRNHSSEEINDFLSRKKKFFEANEMQEKKFRECVKSINLEVKEIAGDGNCLYRAVADQVYGTDNYYEMVKSKCLDYVGLEKDFFSQFIEGGSEKFEDYVTMKRMDGVWGDDIEIQALSEIYNRPIEIYSHSIQPLKTFHENDKSYARGTDRGSNHKWLPIRLSYHGKAHYNSLTPIDDIALFKSSLLRSPPGEYENIILEQVKNKNIQFREKNFPANEINKTRGDESKVNIENSRLNFAEKNNFSSKEGDNLHEILQRSEDYATDQDILNSVIEQSKYESSMGKKENYNQSDLTTHPSVKFILEMGFTLEEAILAYSAVGDDPDLMLQYLYSMMS